MSWFQSTVVGICQWHSAVTQPQREQDRTRLIADEAPRDLGQPSPAETTSPKKVLSTWSVHGLYFPSRVGVSFALSELSQHVLPHQARNREYDLITCSPTDINMSLLLLPPAPSASRSLSVCISVFPATVPVPARSSVFLRTCLSLPIVVPPQCIKLQRQGYFRDAGLQV
jgi:hypothetical protein